MKELDELKEKCVQAMKDVDAFVDEHYEELYNEIRKQRNIPEDWIVKIVSNCGVVHGCYRQTDKDKWFRVIYNNGFWLEMVQLAYMAGAAEADANPINLWKPADGEDLPEIDREVIVLTQPYPLEENEYAVYFAHRPNPNGWDGKSVTTGEIEHYIPKTYDKGGWNQPNVKWWLDLELPKMEE